MRALKNRMWPRVLPLKKGTQNLFSGNFGEPDKMGPKVPNWNVLPTLGQVKLAVGDF